MSEIRRVLSLPLSRMRTGRAVEDSTATTGGSASEPLLKVGLIHLRYGLVPALRGVTLEIQRGEMVALLGANGAGKTSTLRAISGMVRPTSGEVIFEGRRIHGMQAWDIVKLGIAHMPEGRELFAGLSVRENLRYGFFPQAKTARGTFKPTLDYVYSVFPRLAERQRQKAGTLSGGEQQMLTAAMALMSRPKLLLVDELSLGLAPKIVKELFAVLRRVNETGTSILLVEQFVPLALANTSRAYVLSKGEVVMARSSAELKDDPSLTASYLGGHVGEDEDPELERQVHAAAGASGAES
jgi:branched-chain amino acid transport system ATP-binding protein